MDATHDKRRYEVTMTSLIRNCRNFFKFPLNYALVCLWFVVKLKLVGRSAELRWGSTGDVTDDVRNEVRSSSPRFHLPSSGYSGKVKISQSNVREVRWVWGGGVFNRNYCFRTRKYIFFWDTETERERVCVHDSRISLKQSWVPQGYLFLWDSSARLTWHWN